MFYLGLTSTSLTQMALTANAPKANTPRSKLIEKETVGGDLNITVTGRTRAEVTVPYQEIEKAEYDQLKQYCYPYVVNKVWARVTNGTGDLIFDGYAFAKMQSEKITRDNNKFTLNVEITAF